MDKQIIFSKLCLGVNIKESLHTPSYVQSNLFTNYTTAFCSFPGLMYEAHVGLNKHMGATDIGEESLFKCFVWKLGQVETDVLHL